MMVLILADKDDYMVTCVKNETADFYCTEDISEFISKRADICFIDFGAVCSVFDTGDFTWELRQLVKHIKENQSRKFYFCLIMPSGFYDEYDEVWKLSNVIKVTYSEWVKGDAIKRIIRGIYNELTDSLFNDLPKQSKSSKQCKDCKHIQKWQCGGSFFFYCAVTKSNRTYNRLKKVKCKTPACWMFEIIDEDAK